METTEQALAQAEELLKPWTVQVTRPDALRMDVYVDRAQFKPAVQAVQTTFWGYLAAITGLDQPAKPAAEGEEQAEDHIEVLYHFCQGAAVLTLRVSVPYSDPVLPTVCDLDPAATLYERELMELFGVVIEGTPNPDRLVLPDDWPDGVYPLRKSFTGFSNPPSQA